VRRRLRGRDYLALTLAAVLLILVVGLSIATQQRLTP
jgi:hypothetical protein